MKIDLLRQKIDKIDRKFINLIGERFRLTGEIGEIKKKSGLKVFDKKREASIMEAVSEEASRVGVDENMLKKIYKIIFVESRKRQG